MTKIDNHIASSYENEPINIPDINEEWKSFETANKSLFKRKKYLLFFTYFFTSIIIIAALGFVFNYTYQLGKKSSLNVSKNKAENILKPNEQKQNLPDLITIKKSNVETNLNNTHVDLTIKDKVSKKVIIDFKNNNSKNEKKSLKNIASVNPYLGFKNKLNNNTDAIVENPKTIASNVQKLDFDPANIIIQYVNINSYENSELLNNLNNVVAKNELVAKIPATESIFNISLFNKIKKPREHSFGLIVENNFFKNGFLNLGFGGYYNYKLAKSAFQFSCLFNNQKYGNVQFANPDIDEVNYLDSSNGLFEISVRKTVKTGVTKNQFITLNFGYQHAILPNWSWYIAPSLVIPISYKVKVNNLEEITKTNKITINAVDKEVNNISEIIEIKNRLQLKARIGTKYDFKKFVIGVYLQRDVIYNQNFNQLNSYNVIVIPKPTTSIGIECAIPLNKVKR